MGSPNSPVDGRTRVVAGTRWGNSVPYSRAVRDGAWIAVSGTTAARDQGGAVGGSDIGAQTRETIVRISAALNELGSSLDEIVRLRIFVTDISRWEQVGAALAEFFSETRPAASMVEVQALIDPALLIEIEADALAHRAGSEPTLG